MGSSTTTQTEDYISFSQKRADISGNSHADDRELPAAQRLGLCSPSARSLGSISGRKAKTPQAFRRAPPKMTNNLDPMATDHTNFSAVCSDVGAQGMKRLKRKLAEIQQKALIMYCQR